MSILVTGATGLIGYHIASQLKERYPKKEIKGLVRNPKKISAKRLEQKGIRIIKGDITNKKSLEIAFEDIKSVFHVAALVRELHPKKMFYEVNYNGTKNVLDLFEKNKGEKFCYTSTIGIYGFNHDNSITERTKVDLISGYRESKYLGEKEVFKRANKRNFFATSIRPSFVFGPHDKQFAPKLFNLVTSKENKGKVPIINRGKAILPLTYVKDVANVHIKSINTQKAKNEAFNCIGYQITQKELFENIANIAGVSIKFRNLNYSFATIIGLLSEFWSAIQNTRPVLTRMRVKQFGKSRNFDTSKIEKTLGFEPQYSLKEALKETYEWINKTSAKSVI